MILLFSECVVSCIPLVAPSDEALSKGMNHPMEISQPVRVKRTYLQTLIAPPEIVFPLLCPVREVEWANGWNPRLVVTGSGFVEPGCVFIVPDKPQESTWVVTQWDPQAYFVEFIKVIPEFTVGKIEIQLRKGDSAQTLAEVTYSFTALSRQGAEFVEQFTSERYEEFMKEWESELNHFLQTGTKQENGM